MRALQVIFSLVLILPFQTYSYRSFLSEIPNGDNVQHPCDSEKKVLGIGHINLRGGGRLNGFGRDFMKHREWKAICVLDSDGDGLTNGEELGDPECVWITGSVPVRSVNISHPGVCTPTDSKICEHLNYCNPTKVTGDTY